MSFSVGVRGLQLSTTSGVRLLNARRWTSQGMDSIGKTWSVASCYQEGKALFEQFGISEPEASARFLICDVADIGFVLSA
jgi:hypothetical protein